MSNLNNAAGVDYDTLDGFKRRAQQLAVATAGALTPLGWREVPESRGESAYVIELPDCYIAHVEEGLGTKCVTADEVRDALGQCHYHSIGIDAVATIVNDLVTVGAMPASLAMHLAVGSADWFKNELRSGDLLHGWRYGCELAGCAWGPGETPELKNLVQPGGIVLGGSGIGQVKPKARLLHESRIVHGDDIYLFESSGLQTNGHTRARQITATLPQGYATSCGRTTLGEALMTPSRIYASVLRACHDAGVDVHYAVHVSGHGFRKLMRPKRPLTYVINSLPAVPEVFNVLQAASGMTNEECFASFNMGAGFALYVAYEDRARMSQVLRALQQGGHDRHRGLLAGSVLDDGKKRVIIKPKGITYAGDALNIR